jgi:hypothetical protein
MVSFEGSEMSRGLIYLLASLTSVLGCRATPYQKLGTDTSGGYSEKSLGDDMYFIRFSGNASITDATLRRYLYRRAAEVTLKNGYPYFIVVRPAAHTTEFLEIYAHEDQWKDMLPPSKVEPPDPSCMIMTIRCVRQAPEDHNADLIDARRYLSCSGQ